MSTSLDRASGTGASAFPTFDVTARKAHQWTMIALVVIGFVLGGPAGAIPLAIAGLIMLAGRFWWPADVVRQVVWRALEPWGILRRHELHEDHETRRVARVLGGAIWLFSAGLILVGLSTIGWVLSGLIAVMVALDATVDFCALCFIFAQLDRRGVLRRS